jgi:hypothetical protein
LRNEQQTTRLQQHGLFNNTGGPESMNSCAFMAHPRIFEWREESWRMWVIRLAWEVCALQQTSGNDGGGGTQTAHEFDAVGLRASCVCQHAPSFTFAIQH